MNKPLVALAASLAGLGCSFVSSASMITLTGTQFDVVYDSSQLGLFGTPELFGDNLVFTPNQFDAQSLNGAGTVTANSIASDIELVAHPGFEFGNLSVAAIGDYLMQGPGTSVGVAGTLTAADAARPLTLSQANLIVGTPLNIADGITHNWTGTATISNATPTETPGYNPWLGEARTIDVALANTLTATTTGSSASQAFIQEKFSSVELIIDPIPMPLPGTLWLVLCGLLPIAGISIRRRAAAAG